MKKILSISLLILVVCIQSWAQSEFDFLLGRNKDYADVVVEKVIDTNTFTIRNDQNQNDYVQLIGLKALKAPKQKKDIKRNEYGFIIEEEVKPYDSLDEQAFEYVKTLLEGKHVRLEFDVQRNSEDHYELAYVYLIDSNLFVNAEILRRGYAHLQIQPPNLKHAEKLRDSYKEARQNRLGLHGE